MSWDWRRQNQSAVTIKTASNNVAIARAKNRPPGRSMVRDHSEGASPARASRNATTLSPIVAPASECPPAAMTTYCSPFQRYVMGLATPEPERGDDQNSEQQRGDSAGEEPSTGTVDGARPQRGCLARSRKPKRHHAVADRGARFRMPAGCDDDVLLAFPEICHGIGDARTRAR